MIRAIEDAIKITERELDCLGFVCNHEPIAEGITSIYEKSDETNPEMLAAAYLDYGENPPKDYNEWRKSWNHWFGVPDYVKFNHSYDSIGDIEDSYNDMFWDGEIEV